MNSVQLKHFIELYFPGVLLFNTREEKIDERDPSEVDFSDMVYAFRFFDRKVVKDGEEELSSKKINKSEKVYIDGEIKTYQEINDQTILDNMDTNMCECVIKTRHGQHFRVDSSPVLIYTNGEIKEVPIKTWKTIWGEPVKHLLIDETGEILQKIFVYDNCYSLKEGRRTDINSKTKAMKIARRKSDSACIDRI